MSQNGSGKIFVFIFVLIAIVSATFFFIRREQLRKQTKDLLDRANKLATSKLPEPTPSFVVTGDASGFNIPKLTTTPTPTVTASPSATPTPKDDSKTASATTKGGETVASVKGTSTKKTTSTKTGVVICTPVYGMANSCAEHVVVDTAIDTGIFTNMAILSYVGGLVAFVKAKRK